MVDDQPVVGDVSAYTSSESCASVYIAQCGFSVADSATYMTLTVEQIPVAVREC